MRGLVHHPDAVARIARRHPRVRPRVALRCQRRRLVDRLTRYRSWRERRRANRSKRQAYRPAGRERISAARRGNLAGELSHASRHADRGKGQRDDGHGPPECRWLRDRWTAWTRAIGSMRDELRLLEPAGAETDASVERPDRRLDASDRATTGPRADRDTRKLGCSGPLRHRRQEEPYRGVVLAREGVDRLAIDDAEWPRADVSIAIIVDAREVLRHEVALANRIIERLGLSNAFGHVSARIPGSDTFLFPPRRSPGFADEKSLMVLDTDGKLLSGKGTPNSELWIHARTYAARGDIGGVVHAHPPACVCLTQIGEPHRIVHNQGGAFADGVAELKRVGLIRTRELGDLLAQRLGRGLSIMMRGHGITTAAADVRTATIAACFLEESAALQLRMLAAAGGDAGRIRAYAPEEAERVRDQLPPAIVERAWEYYAAVAELKPLGG